MFGDLLVIVSLFCTVTVIVYCVVNCSCTQYIMTKNAPTGHNIVPPTKYYKIHGNFLSNSFVFFKFPARLCKFSPARVINPKTLSIFSTIVWQERKNEGAWESLIYHPIPTVYGTLVGQIWKKFNFCKSSLKVIKWKWYLHNTFTSPTQWIFIENLIFLTVNIVHRRNRR